MTYRIGMIPYANMGPFRVSGLPAGFDAVPTTPTQTTQALINGEVLAGAVPVGDLARLLDSVEFVDTFGIAAAGPVASVLLFADIPMAALVAPARIFLTEQSSSSVRLLFLLLRQRNGPANLPCRTTDRTGAAAELLIGDDAMQQAAINRRPFVCDLAEEWSLVTGLPMVFARWVIRRDAEAAAKNALSRWLHAFAEQEVQCVAEAATVEAARLGVGREAMLVYLNGMRRTLTAEDLAGQALFQKMLRDAGPGPLFRTDEGVARA